MKLKKEEYLITYLSNGEKIEELYSTIEVILMLIYAKMLKKVRVIRIKRSEFYSENDERNTF